MSAKFPGGGGAGPFLARSLWIAMYGFTHNISFAVRALFNLEPMVQTLIRLHTYFQFNV